MHGVQITVEGKHHLGAALGSHLFTEQYVNEKVTLCSCCIVALSDIARVHPHAIHSAFTHGLCNKCMDLLSTYHPRDLFTLGNIGSCNLFKVLLPLQVGQLVMWRVYWHFLSGWAVLALLILRPSRTQKLLPQRIKVTTPLVVLILQREMSFSYHVVDAAASG